MISNFHYFFFVFVLSVFDDSVELFDNYYGSLGVQLFGCTNSTQLREGIFFSKNLWPVFDCCFDVNRCKWSVLHYIFLVSGFSSSSIPACTIRILVTEFEFSRNIIIVENFREIWTLRSEFQRVGVRVRSVLPIELHTGLTTSQNESVLYNQNYLIRDIV